jgi:hypothetical protein
MQMGQESSCWFLPNEGFTSCNRRKEMKAALGEIAVHCSTITKCLRERPLGSYKTTGWDSDDDAQMSDTTEAILSGLAIQLFVSVWEIFWMILLPKATVYSHLTQSLGFVSRCLQWVVRMLALVEKRQELKTHKNCWPRCNRWRITNGRMWRHLTSIGYIL